MMRDGLAPPNIPQPPIHPRDCPYGRQWGKCADCDLVEERQENAALRARAETAEQELDDIFEDYEAARKRANKAEQELAALRAEALGLREALEHPYETFIAGDGEVGLRPRQVPAAPLTTAAAERWKAMEKLYRDCQEAERLSNGDLWGYPHGRQLEAVREDLAALAALDGKGEE